MDDELSARLRHRLPSWQEMFRPELQLSLRRWSWSVRMSAASIEFAHGRNKRRTSHASAWSTFASEYLRSETQLSNDTTREVLEQNRNVIAQRAGINEQSQCRKRAWTRAKTPLDLFRTEWYAQQRRLGRNVNPCSQGAWQDVKAAWEALTLEKRASYREQADTQPSKGLRRRLEEGMQLAPSLAPLQPPQHATENIDALVAARSSSDIVAPHIETCLSHDDDLADIVNCDGRGMSPASTPLSAKRFADALVQGASGPSIKATSRCFVRNQAHVGKPRADLAVDVQYPRKAMARSVLKASPSHAALYHSLGSLLFEMVSTCEKCKLCV